MALAALGGAQLIHALQRIGSERAGAERWALWLLPLTSLVMMVATVALPWRRWDNRWALLPAVSALGLLVLVELVGHYGRSRGAAATYPLFVALVLTWVGLTQPRRAALAFSLCGGAALAAVVLGSGRGVIPLASLLIVVPAGAALGEAAAWLMGELRRLQHHDERRAAAFINLIRTLDHLPPHGGPGAVAARLASGAATLFAVDAEVTLVDANGVEATACSTEAAAASATDVGADLRADLGNTDGTAVIDLTSAAAPASKPPSGRRLTFSLVGERGLLGRVHLATEPDPDDVYLANLVRLFAAQASAAIERLEMVTQLDHEINHDVLTGTGNRRHANTLLATLHAGDGLLLIDIDRFKTLNDTQGHLAGDALLQRLGQYLTGFVRGGDGVARLGGDEFVVLARNVGEGAAAAADRLLEGWRALGESTNLTIGVALHQPAEQSSATLERADQALYEAKRAGGDRVGMAPAAGESSTGASETAEAISPR
ncbi:MAG: diguanylate cyclase domain-containing protein [Acidimicrobiales bacterium]